MIEDGGRAGGKHKARRVTAFYIEALILVALLTVMILVLTWVFAWAGQCSMRAGLLTDAVHLAENGAEAVAASKSLEEVRELLEENGNADIIAWPDQEDSSEDGEVPALRVYYDDDLNPAREGELWMDIRWMEPVPGEGTGGSGLVESVITVNRAGEGEPVYTLKTAVYIGKE